MDPFSSALLLSAMGISLLHTLAGPDHYVPFIMLARAQRWTWVRTLTVTALCGVGHVLSSLCLGAIGLALGFGLADLETAEGLRSDLAAWALVAFGLAYSAWGVRKALGRRRAIAVHSHHGLIHVHAHGGHPHEHDTGPQPANATSWTLFIAFVLGPCEPLVPLFMLPAGRGNWGAAAATAAVFGGMTVASMLALTAMGLLGLRRLDLGAWERWAPALAGATVAVCGLGVLAFGL